MTRNIARKFLAFAALAFAAGSPGILRAQDTAASLTGVVTDATGAAVPGAVVELSNPATGQTYKATTNAIGSYTLSNVTPGPGYKETISRDGFQTAVLTGLYMNVSTTRTQNVNLAVGSVSQTLTVSASADTETLNTTDATIGNNFQVQFMNELPVSLRDSPAALFTQQPGMTQDGSSTGSRTDQNRVTLDGLDVNDMATGGFGAMIANAPVDSVQEFRGTTAGMLSSNGNGGGGQFDMVTKSGTNQFHGNINEYHRDTDLEANEWFNNFDGVPRSPLIRNQFGGNLGGPVWKNKAFFFFDYNGRRDTLAGQAERTVPTDSFLKSNTITYYNNIAAGTTGSIDAAQIAAYDPQGVGLSSSMFSVMGGRYPSPNDFTGDQGDLLNTAGFRFNAPTPYKENNYVGRLDLNPFENHHFFGRVTYNKINAVHSAVQFPGDPETYPYLDTSHAWVLGWDWLLGANKTNSFFWGATVANLGFPVTYNPQGANQYGWDGDPTGGFFLSGIYGGAAGAQSRYFPIPVVRDDFNWNKGSHNFSFGGTFKYPSPHYSTYSDYNGPNLGLGGGVTGLTDGDPGGWKFRPDDLDRNQTSLTIYDSAFVFGLGRFASAGATYNYNAAGSVVPQGTGLQTKFRYYETELYFGDSWKAKPNLTFTYGVRYQNYTVPYEVHGIESVQSESFWDFMNARIAQSAAGVGGPASLPGGGSSATVPYITYSLGGKANHGPAYYAPSNWNFAPRVAFAWTPSKNGKLVVNGGAGVVYDQTVINALLFEQAQYSYLFESSGTANYGISGDANHSSAYYSLLQNTRFSSLASPPPLPSPPAITKPYSPFIGPGDPNCGGATGPCGLANGGAFNITVDRHLPTPYNIMYNLGMQQEIKGGFILKMSYVGRLGRRLLAQADAEQLIDFPDKASGQNLSQAMANLTTWLRNNPNADPTTAPAQPWFENVLYPSGAGGTNTGFIASEFSPYPARGDVADTVELMSYFGLLPANVGMGAQFSENTFFTDMGFSAYNGLLTTLHKNVSHGLQFDLNYTWSHSIDNVSLIANSTAYSGYGFVCDVLRPRLCRGNSDFDVSNYLNGNFLYQLPFGRGRDFASSIPWWADEVIGGWELSGLPSWHTGTPYMANSVAFLMSYSNEDPAILTGSLGPMKSHVTVQGGQVYAFKNYQQAYSQYRGPVGFEIGSRNNLRGPGFFDLDLGVGKTFPIYKEGVKLKFRVDAFNALNHPNFEAPSFQNNMSLVASPNEFGVVPGTVVPNGSDESARVLQGSLRLEF
jgi:hypothetical protein